MSEPATTSARPAFPRHPRLRSFARKFGRAYVDLACHAAFPIALTPDLLYMLWGGFPRDVLDQPIGAPWVAVADLLLSSMCDEVGHELYELDPAVREELLAELRANPRFGPQRAAELSDFVARYVEQQLRSSDPFVRDFAEAQHWAARAAVDPAAAAAELARAYAEVQGDDRERLLRLEAIVAALARPERAGEIESLLPYARALADWARGDTARAATVLRAMATAGGQIQIGGVVLPVPQDLATPPAPQAASAAAQQADFGEAAQQAASAPNAPQVPAEPSEELLLLLQRREATLRRLRALEQQQAYFGLNSPVALLNDLQEAQKEISNLDTQIQLLGGTPVRSGELAEEIAHLQALYATQQRRLHILEEQVARFSEQLAPPQTMAELRAVQEDIAATSRRLRELGVAPEAAEAQPPAEAAPQPLGDDEREQLEQLRQAHRRTLYMLEEQQARYGMQAPANLVLQAEDTRARLAELDRQLGSALPLDDEERAHLARLQALHVANLQNLETQSARYGASVPSHIALEIEDLRAQIAEIDRRLGQAPPAETAVPNVGEVPQAAAPAEAQPAAAPAEAAAPGGAITLHIARQGQGFSADLNDGTGWLRARLVLSDEQLGAAASAAREALKEIVFTQIGGQYTYQVASTTIPAEVHAQSLQKLARAGAQLYERLFYAPGGDGARQLGDRLRELSRGARLRVRVVAETFFIPWGLLYDRALADADQIDPEGFWGFRHVIECQVPSSEVRSPTVLSEEAEPAATPAIEPREQLELAFVGNNALDTQFNQLQQPIVQTQRQFMAALPNVRLAEFATVPELYALLSDASSPAQLIYFYCQLVHKRASDAGGIDASALGLTDARVKLSELKERTPPGARLPGAPLVFLNTASSAELDPTRFEGFTPFFLAHGARTVVGSETNMPAVFAAEFGQEFVKRFAAGEQSAGNLLLNMRRAYLQQRNNLLGLLYALYGDADTQVVWPAPEPPRAASKGSPAQRSGRPLPR
ncbi:CHAT domain-containing protein [Kouleothrix sp.]|uniref:CHAT domain-containing protein n=1 Tax=Kouleothrix sp. TaxID=2779161 RepID=UPI003918822B